MAVPPPRRISEILPTPNRDATTYIEQERAHSEVMLPPNATPQQNMRSTLVGEAQLLAMSALAPWVAPGITRELMIEHINGYPHLRQALGPQRVAQIEQTINRGLAALPALEGNRDPRRTRAGMALQRAIVDHPNVAAGLGVATLRLATDGLWAIPRGVLVGTGCAIQPWAQQANDWLTQVTMGPHDPALLPASAESLQAVGAAQDLLAARLSFQALGGATSPSLLGSFLAASLQGIGPPAPTGDRAHDVAAQRVAIANMRAIAHIAEIAVMLSAVYAVGVGLPVVLTAASVIELDVWFAACWVAYAGMYTLSSDLLQGNLAAMWPRFAFTALPGLPPSVRATLGLVSDHTPDAAERMDTVADARIEAAGNRSKPGDMAFHAQFARDMCDLFDAHDQAIRDQYRDGITRGHPLDEDREDAEEGERFDKAHGALVQAYASGGHRREDAGLSWLAGIIPVAAYKGEDHPSNDATDRDVVCTLAEVLLSRKSIKKALAESDDRKPLMDALRARQTGDPDQRALLAFCRQLGDVLARVPHNQETIDRVTRAMLEKLNQAYVESAPVLATRDHPAAMAMAEHVHQQLVGALGGLQSQCYGLNLESKLRTDGPELWKTAVMRLLPDEDVHTATLDHLIDAVQKRQAMVLHGTLPPLELATDVAILAELLECAAEFHLSRGIWQWLGQSRDLWPAVDQFHRLADLLRRVSRDLNIGDLDALQEGEKTSHEYRISTHARHAAGVQAFNPYADIYYAAKLTADMANGLDHGELSESSAASLQRYTALNHAVTDNAAPIAAIRFHHEAPHASVGLLFLGKAIERRLAIPNEHQKDIAVHELMFPHFVSPLNDADKKKWIAAIDDDTGAALTRLTLGMKPHIKTALEGDVKYLRELKRQAIAAPPNTQDHVLRHLREHCVSTGKPFNTEKMLDIVKGPDSVHDQMELILEKARDPEADPAWKAFAHGVVGLVQPHLTLQRDQGRIPQLDALVNAGRTTGAQYAAFY